LGGVEKLKNVSVTHNPPPSPFAKGGIITPPFSKGRRRRPEPAFTETLRASRPDFGAGRLGGIFLLTNSKGISVLFLVIAMMLMVSIGYVFSYLIPTKQKGASFPIHSIKAFYLAQSGVEFAVRFAIDSGWTTPANLVGLTGVTRNLGDRNGRFTLNYDRPNNALISIGVIPNGSERSVEVSNFTSFLRNPKGVILDPRSAPPCWVVARRRAQFYIRNAREDSIILRSFSASWIQTGTARTISRINMAGVQKYTGAYVNGTPAVNLNRPLASPTQTINSNQAIQVVVYWNLAMTTCTDIVITFYTGLLGTGDAYTFYLTPNGTGLPNC
jgi:hypothetical protein